jgi:hypothetical protein
MIDSMAVCTWGQRLAEQIKDAGREVCLRQTSARGRKDATASRVIQVCRAVGPII